MTATCKCACGNTFHSRVIEDDTDTNSLVIEDFECPECGRDDFEITRIEDNEL